ncbi:MAG: tetratricopeptide repeat protein [Caldilineaceae bacterium]
MQGVADTYVDLFTEYVIGGVRASLAQVRAHEYVVPDDVREQAWHVLSFALEVEAAWAATKELLLELAPKMEQGGFRETWIPYLEQGVRKSVESRDWTAENELCYQIGLLYRLLNKHDSARVWLSRALNNHVLDKSTRAQIFNQFAYLEWQQGDVSRSIEYARSALQLIDDLHVERAMAFSVLGLIAVERSQWQEAESYHRQALQIRETSGAQRQVAQSLQNLAVALRCQNRFAEAINAFRQARLIFEQIGDKTSNAIASMNLGLAKFYSGDVWAAFEQYEFAEAIFLKHDDLLNQARICVNFGLAYLKIDRVEQAEQSFDRAVKLFAEIGNEGQRLNAVDGLALAYMAQNRYAEANKLLLQSLQDLSLAKDIPNHSRLEQIMHEHLSQLEKAQEGQKLESPS